MDDFFYRICYIFIRYAAGEGSHNKGEIPRKKALKAALGLLVVSLTFSSCELFLLGVALNELAKDGQGSADDPVSLTQGNNYLYVGDDGTGQYSYYTFTVPTESNAVTITYSSASNADLVFSLYANDIFTYLVEEEDSSGTPPTVLFDN